MTYKRGFYPPRKNRALTKTRTHVWLVIDHKTGEIKAYRRYKPALYDLWNEKVPVAGMDSRFLKDELKALHYLTESNQSRWYSRAGSTVKDIQILRLQIV